MTKTYKVVRIDWRSLKSIEQSERGKTRLEDNGYTLIRSTSGLDTAQLMYEREE